MKKLDRRDIKTGDIAVSFHGVTKTFEQWQRSGGIKNTLQNLIRPQKKTIAALDDVSFTINRGEFTAYAGPNGAGKSTTIKLICGMLLPLQGEISVLGMSPAKNRIALMKKVGVMFGNRTELWWDHPVLQSFEWKREVWDIPKEQYKRTLDRLVELLDIQDILHTFARELSLGQRMKADLTMTLLHAPELILLDEPTIGLDVLAKRQMISFLKELNQEKETTILVTSHDMDDLEQMARRIIMVESGHVAFDGSFSSLRAVTGSKCKISLELLTDASPEFEGAALLSREGRRFEYEFDMGRTSMSAVLSQIGAVEGVMNVEIKKAPIEDVIAGLYVEWKKQ
ncbi:MAG: ATP-binding cassette domain-containing protein [Oscillospiraceae bacterium]|nr:ATP-binding cassette domain-containing protein [Oscillospiraceae bacterium]